MKKLVVIVSLMLVSAFGFSQENNEKATAAVTPDTTTVETLKVEVSKDTTETVAFVSNRAMIDSNFDKASFLFRGRKSKRIQLC